MPFCVGDLATVRKKDSGDGEGADGQQLSQHKWKGARSIGLAHQLNQQFIELCWELSLDGATGHPFPVVASYRDLWRQLDPVARQRLSLFPQPCIGAAPLPWTVFRLSFLIPSSLDRLYRTRQLRSAAEGGRSSSLLGFFVRTLEVHR